MKLLVAEANAPLPDGKAPVKKTGPHPADTVKPKEKEDELVCWKDFVQATTFHGIKYVFAGSGSVWRRVFWTAVVTTAVLTFVIQVGMRMSLFGKYETTTGVTQRYDSIIKFPAVTICNQNAYRITKASEWGAYDFIDRFYRGEPEAEMPNLKLEGNDTENFLESASHQLGDMVERCYWDDSHCDMNDFEVTKTSHGLCFTFNSGTQSPLTITKAGNAGMLKLILNAETYEHMRGPNNDAGIKVILHDQAVPVAVVSEEKGIVVAPGKHYFVGITQTQYEELPPPYGLCDLDVNQTQAECLKGCRDKSRTVLCKCEAPHIKNSQNIWPSCNLTQLLFCFNSGHKMENGTYENCTEECAYPCRKTSFGSKVSFAELSKFNIERMLFKNGKRREEILTKFLHAKEVVNIVIYATAQTDFKLIKHLDEAVSKTRSVIIKALETLDEKRFLEASMALITVIQEDNQKMDGNLAQQYYAFASTVFKVNDIQRNMSHIIRQYSPYENSKKCDALKTCSEDPNLNTSGTFTDFSMSFKPCQEKYASVVSNVTKEGYFDTVQKWIEESSQTSSGYFAYGYGNSASSPVDYDVEKSTDCPSVISDSLTTMKKIFETIMNLKGLTENLLELYKRVIQQTFYNTGTSPESFPEHARCMSSLEEMASVYSEPLAAFPNDVSSPSFELYIDLVGLVLNISKAGRKLETPINVYNKAQICNWLPKYNKIDTISLFLTTMNTAIHGMKQLASLSPDLIQLGNHILPIINTELKNISTVAMSFAARNTTKYDLALRFEDSYMNQKLDELAGFMAEYKRKAADMMSVYRQSWFSIKWVFDETIGLEQRADVPILNETVVLNLAFSRYATRSLIESFIIAKDLHTKKEIYSNITHHVYKRFVGMYLQDASTTVDDAMTDLKKALSNLRGPLKLHSQECHFETTALIENFLQVDLFYEEMKYDRIVQRPAFETLRLLSEVGGFLGLLLGASVLTVFEFIDYVSLKVHNWWRMKARKTSIKPSF